MPLTKAQLDSIVDIINRRFLSFTFEAVGKRALTDAEIRDLKDAGLLRGSVRNLISDPTTIGKIVALLPPSYRTKILSHDDILKISKKLTPMTDVEKKAIEYAQDHAGEYIRSIKDIAVRDARTEVSRRRSEILRAVREGTSEAIAKRETRSQLKTRLFGLLDDRSRDWSRVAHTEMNTAIQRGIYSEIRDKSDDGENQLVFKRPNPDACKQCLRLYTKDGVTPKIFKLKDLAETNFGLKADSWLPTIGSAHVWCACQLHVLPKGYSFEKKNVAREIIEHGSDKIKQGEIIEDDVYSVLSEENKKKIKQDAILTYTGTTERI